jgi:hypothetical protein
LTSKRFPILAIVAGLLAAAAIAARVILFESGLLYGSSRILYADFVIAGLVISAAALGLKAASETTGLSLSSGINTAVLALGLGVTTLGLLQGLLPNTPYRAAAAACPGVSIEGAPYLAQTGRIGVNARTGAGGGFPQVDRFGGSCTLGFSGYCVGQPIPNDQTEIDDARWLIVYRRSELVSSAKLLGQSPASSLGSQPSPQCPQMGGLPQPGTPTFTPTRLHGNHVRLKARAQSGSLVGYAVRELNQFGGGYQYSLVGVVPRPPSFVGLWRAGTALPQLRHGAGTVELAAASCLAADVPVGQPAVYDARFRAGHLNSLRPSKPLSEADASELAVTACSGPP